MTVQSRRLITWLLLSCAGCEDAPAPAVADAAVAADAPMLFDAAPDDAMLSDAGPSYKLVIEISGNGGRVSSTPAGADCTSTCVTSFPIGSTVVLDASFVSPAAAFLGWDGACVGTPTTCTMLLDRDLTVKARFGSPAASGGWGRFATGNGSIEPDGVVEMPGGDVVVFGTASGGVLVNLGGADLLTLGGNHLFLARYAPDGTHRWSRLYDGSDALYGMGLAASASGDIAISGQFNGTVTIGSPTLNSAGEYDGYVARLDGDGNPMWARRLGGTGGEYLLGVGFDAMDQVVVFGELNSNITFAGQSQTIGEFEQHAMVAAYGPTGDERWFHHYQSTMARAMAAGGDVAIAGTYYAPTNFGLGPVPAPPLTNAFLVRLSTSGVASSQVTFGGVDGAWISALALAPSGGDVVATGSQTLDRLFITRFDQAGSQVWTHEFGRSNGFAVSITPTGQVWLTGEHKGTDFGGGVLWPMAANDYDPFVALFGADGAHQWSMTYGTRSNGGETVRDLTAVGASSFAVIGFATGDLDFGFGTLVDPAPGGGRGYFVEVTP